MSVLNRVYWLVGLMLLSPVCLAQVYPSTGTAWVLPGSWQETVIDGKPHTADQVKAWESQHADVVFGSMQDPEINRRMNAMGYMYAHKFDCRPSKQEAWLSQQALNSGMDVEEGYLHFAEDTQLAMDRPNNGLDYLLEGRPYHLLLIRNGQFSTARLPIKVEPDDKLVMFASYPFERLSVKAGGVPDIARHVTNDEGSVEKWLSLEVEWLIQSRDDLAIRYEGQLQLERAWHSAQAWYQGRHLNTGEPGLAAGLRVWMLELAWRKPTEVESLAITPWLEVRQKRMFIPGWDPANDLDGDGYINQREFSSRANRKASARFRHQARLIPAGYMWPGTCWYRVNFLNRAFNKLHVQWYQEDWLQQGLSGAYNDDMAKLLGENQFKVISGGEVRELAMMAGSKQVEYEYAKQLADFLKQVKTLTGTQWLAANISELNLWHYAPWPPELRDVIDVWLREHYLTPAIGLDRLQRYWDSFALAGQQDKSLIMASTKGGRSQYSPSEPAAWQQDIETGLTLYYLFNVPGQTFYHSWNQSYRYGSGNTTPDNWYQAGIGKNIAYQPTAMLKVDIGIPEAAPEGAELVVFDDKGKEADSAATNIGGIPLQPSGWYWLQRSGWFGELPEQGVIARRYSKGLVLYRGARERNNAAFFSTEPREVSLDGYYQQVNADGSLGPAVSQVSLSGYQGMILKRAIEKK
ncbi:hypothetical protein LRP52_03130 [Photobacterium sp. ZSDE20]|uniref:EF-hand domain-containing protein n=1 Tax=Photobacterium pectinilyticum TaxID=2906793 RepID=A0ABT1MX47_9GAMM|nr:hypothetical protein [Photobacterium sp. ZSDE20]MCQ1057066.1 hypothetical protein [Photobacterium sp. ZSDE20]MDD1821201.1 hypothetical protein [Photobacterium sp. ZSDE20]